MKPSTAAKVASAALAMSMLTSEAAMAANHAPVLNASKSPVLAPECQNAGAPSGAVGTLISALVDFAVPSGQVDNVTDSDAGAKLGIAVTAANTSNGSWWYSKNNGTNWYALGAVTNKSARLLAADASTRIYFTPNANYYGTLATAITFRAWDQTSGTNGGLANTTSNGGSHGLQHRHRHRQPLRRVGPAARSSAARGVPCDVCGAT